MSSEQTQQLVQTALAFVTRWGMQALGALAVLAVGWIVAGMVRRALRRAFGRSRIDATLQPFLVGLVYYATLAVVIIAVLHLFGIQTTSLVAVLGAAGLAIGLALQSTLAHFASGVMLLAFRPIRVGDWVEVAGVAGTVVEVGIFATILKSGDNIRITVPNSKIYGDIIKNYNGFDSRRIDLVMGISYDDDIGTAVDTIRTVLGEESRIKPEPEPVVAVSNLGESSVDLVVRPWVATADYWPVRFDLTRKLKERLEAAGCSIPYPQRDVHVFASPDSEAAGEARTAVS